MTLAVAASVHKELVSQDASTLLFFHFLLMSPHVGCNKKNLFMAQTAAL